MTIASELTKLNTNLTNAYTAVSDKGGTLPSAQNFDNLATAISSIPSGGGSQTKYGANINTLLGDVNANGVLQLPTEQSDLVFTGVEDVASQGLYYKFGYSKVKSVSFPDLEQVSGSYGCYDTFYNCQALTSVSLPKLTTISESYGCASMFGYCENLTDVSLPNLTTINGSYGCTGMFQYCYDLTDVSLPNLTTISGRSGCNYMFQHCNNLINVSLPNLTTISGSSGCNYMFYYCQALTSVSLPKLTTISNNAGCAGMFGYCINLADVYFPSLTTSSFGSYKNQFANILSNTTNTTTHTLHFPSNLQSTISGLTGYPLFGGSSGKVVCAFDLPATS